MHLIIPKKSLRNSFAKEKNVAVYVCLLMGIFVLFFNVTQCTLKCIHAILFQNDEDVNSEISEDVLSDSENNETNSNVEEEGEATDSEEFQVST